MNWLYMKCCRLDAFALFNVESSTSNVTAVADPGFPVGGDVDLVGGAPTPKAVTFEKF